jgi:hypothetical protein
VHKAPTFLLLREGEGERGLGLSCLVEYFFMSVENKKKFHIRVQIKMVF